MKLIVFWRSRCPPRRWILKSLLGKNNDGDGYENVTKKWILASSNFIGLISSRSIRQMLANFLELNSKRLYQSSGKEKESRGFVFTSSTKLEIRRLHVVVLLRRQGIVQKSVMHVQSCSFANLNLLLYCRSRCRRRRCCLSLSSPSPVTVPEVFAKVNSVQFPRL